MLFEKNEIEGLTKDIDETSASLVAFLEVSNLVPQNM